MVMALEILEAVAVAAYVNFGNSIAEPGAGGTTWHR
jgi:hypothetical protein